jgi:hypothetical protein
VFDITHDSLRPFEVRSANAITEDLGLFHCQSVSQRSACAGLRGIGKSRVARGWFAGEFRNTARTARPRRARFVGRTTVRNASTRRVISRGRVTASSSTTRRCRCIPGHRAMVRHPDRCSRPRATEAARHAERSRSLPARRPRRCYDTPQTAIRETWVAVHHRIARPVISNWTAPSSHQSHG